MNLSFIQIAMQVELLINGHFWLLLKTCLTQDVNSSHIPWGSSCKSEYIHPIFWPYDKPVKEKTFKGLGYLD